MFIPKLIVKKVDYKDNISFITNLLVPEHSKRDKSLPFEERVYGLFPELKGKINEHM